jgi:type VI secretion system protein ImpL
MGALVVRRGNTITPRTWGELGTLQPEFMTDFARWVSPLEGGAAADASGGGTGGGGQAQTAFMLRPQASPGTTGYVIEIDGQKLSYRNGVAQWANFVWPNASGAPGPRSPLPPSRKDCRRGEYPRAFRPGKMINAAQRTRLADGSFHMTWRTEGIEVGIDLKVVSSAQVQASGGEGATASVVWLASCCHAWSLSASLPTQEVAATPAPVADARQARLAGGCNEQHRSLFRHLLRQDSVTRRFRQGAGATSVDQRARSLGVSGDGAPVG